MQTAEQIAKRLTYQEIAEVPINTRDMLAAHIAMAIKEEREACARIASGMSDGMDCDDRGAQDPETGEVPCSAESRGEVCVCSERYELAFKIADKIRARSLPTQ